MRPWNKKGSFSKVFGSCSKGEVEGVCSCEDVWSGWEGWSAEAGSGQALQPRC
jgi:hypothetical protein